MNLIDQFFSGMFIGLFSSLTSVFSLNQAEITNVLH